MKLANIIEIASKLNESYPSIDFVLPNFTAILNCTVISAPRDDLMSVSTYFCTAPLHCKVVDILLDDSDTVIHSVACINLDCMNRESLDIKGHYKMKCEFCHNGPVVCHGFKKLS